MSRAHTHGAHKYQELDEVDVELEAAIAAIRRRVERRGRRTIVVRIEIQDGFVTDHQVEELDYLADDLARVMEERPHPRKRGVRQAASDRRGA